MNLSNLSLKHIKILDPVSKEDSFEFPLQYLDENDEKDILFYSNHEYGLSLNKEISECELHIKERNDLKFFNELYKYLNNELFEKHEDYFESPYERKEYNNLFKNYLFPNIEENAVNVHCHIEPSLIESHIDKSKIQVYPTFHLKSIVFQQPSFYISLELKEIKIIPLEEEQQQQEEPPQQEEEEEPPQQEEEPPQQEEEEEPPQNDTIVKETSSSDSLLEEVHIKNDESIDEVAIQLNDEDCFILFKIIQSNIKENFSESILTIFNDKNIETKNINIQDIVYDSENEDSDDDYLENDNFERNYKRMV